MLSMSRKEGLHDLFARIPKELWAALKQEAKSQARSATAQLVVILRERYTKQQLKR